MTDLHPKNLLFTMGILLGLGSSQRALAQQNDQTTPAPRAAGQQEAEQPPHDLPVTDTIYFAFDSSVLNKDSQRTLDILADWLKQHPDEKIQIIGHTDWYGSPDYNEALGQRRAESAKGYLVSRGIDPARVDTYSLGKENLASVRRSELDRRSVFFTTAEPKPQPKPEQTEAAPTTVPKPSTVSKPSASGVQAPPNPATATPAKRTRERPTWRRKTRASKFRAVVPEGASLSAGGAVVDFVDSDARRYTTVGGSWFVRASFGTKSYLGLEAAYIGTSQGVDAIGLNDAKLLGNGAEADLRVNLYPAAVTPFVFGGAGWTHYSVTNRSSSAAIGSKDNIFHVPFGLGVAYRYENAVFELRGMMRAAFADQLLDTVGSSPKLTTWSATGGVGVEL